MVGADQEVLATTLAWLAAGRRVVLATVVKTWGAAPRPPGAWLALRDDGACAGSVSGGCIEDDLADRMREGRLEADLPYLLDYGVDALEAARFGLPCGGQLTVLIESRPDAQLMSELRDALDAGRLVARSVEMKTGHVALKDARRGAGLNFDGERITTVYGPRWRLFIVGAGQIGRYLAEMARALDYAITICDPREETADAWPLADIPLLREMPDDALLAWKPDPHSAVVALSHDPKLDDMLLLEALKSDAFYIGALGSSRSQIKRRERLALFDLSEAQIARLHGPVGLNIGSRLPAEIAVSVLAEITAVKNGVALPARAGSAH